MVMESFTEAIRSAASRIAGKATISGPTQTRAMGQFVRTEYKSLDVAIPDAFLASPPSEPVVAKHIDWASSPLPENQGRTALVLDNVLSKEECAELLSLAESSVPGEDGASPWKPALVNVGVGVETAAPGYRDSERIIWDQQVVVDRVWERMAQAEGVRELLAKCPEGASGEWRFRRLNERMRFLKYSPKQFFKRRLPPTFRT